MAVSCVCLYVLGYLLGVSGLPASLSPAVRCDLWKLGRPRVGILHGLVA